MEFPGHVIVPESSAVRVQEELDGVLKLLRHNFAAADGGNEVDHVTQRVVSTKFCGTYDSSPKYLVRGRIKNLRRCPSCIAML